MAWLTFIRPERRKFCPLHLGSGRIWGNLASMEVLVPSHSDNRPWIIALTGASGTCYGRQLIRTLLENFPLMPLDVVVSEAALRVMREEDGLKLSVGVLKLEDLIGPEFDAAWTERVQIHSNRNIGASIASGSHLTAGMVIVPCSMRTLAAVANGYSDNLVQRAADVTLKERRPLLLVPRETPLSAIHLRNMLRLAKMNVGIIPAMPSFYDQPQQISDLVDQFVYRLIDQMNLPLDLAKRWGAKKQDEKPSRRIQGA